MKVWNLFRGICRPFPVRLHAARQAGGLWTSDAAAGFVRLNLRASFAEVTGAFVRVRPSVQYAVYHVGGEGQSIFLNFKNSSIVLYSFVIGFILIFFNFLNKLNFKLFHIYYLYIDK